MRSRGAELHSSELTEPPEPGLRAGAQPALPLIQQNRWRAATAQAGEAALSCTDDSLEQQ